MEKPTARRHPLKNVRAFRTTLLTWFKDNAQNYPWRETTDPWAILVSEIMLQQTTVAAVIANRRFEKFLEQFPDIQSIATASESEILRAWEGLGYYNRVRNLQRCAQAIIKDFDHRFPSEAGQLITLPGIGKYTAGAVSSFAFNKAAPIVDANIARVISRLFQITMAIDSNAGQKIIWAKAEQLLEKKSPRSFNSALMELGQKICSARLPSCHRCPVKDFCQCHDPEALPTKKPRKAFELITEHALLSLQNEKILLSQGTDTRRKGLWKLPLRSVEECAHLTPLLTRQYQITHHKVTLHLYRHEVKEIQECESYHPFSKLQELPIATPIRKILNDLAL